MRSSDGSSDVCSSDLQATEYVIGAFVVMARLLLPGKPELIRSVHFVHAKPDIAEQVREYFDFFQCPVYFEQEASCFVVANEVLREKLHHGDAFLKDILDLHARKLLQQQRTVSLPDEVRHLIRSEEHTSELQSLMRISYAVFCLKKKKNRQI